MVGVTLGNLETPSVSQGFLSITIFILVKITNFVSIWCLFDCGPNAIFARGTLEMGYIQICNSCEMFGRNPRFLTKNTKQKKKIFCC